MENRFKSLDQETIEMLLKVEELVSEEFPQTRGLFYEKRDVPRPVKYAGIKFWLDWGEWKYDPFLNGGSEKPFALYIDLNNKKYYLERELSLPSGFTIPNKRTKEAIQKRKENEEKLSEVLKGMSIEQLENIYFNPPIIPCNCKKPELTCFTKELQKILGKSYSKIDDTDLLRINETKKEIEQSFGFKEIKNLENSVYWWFLSRQGITEDKLNTKPKTKEERKEFDENWHYERWIRTFAPMLAKDKNFLTENGYFEWLESQA